MSLCYYCGKEGETTSCQHCGIKFCSEHIDPIKHNCIAFKETSSFKTEVKEKSPEREVYVEEIPLTPVKRQKKKSNKMIIAVGMIMISLSSIVLVSMFAGNQGLEGVTPPEVDYELHSVALSQVNVYRYRNDLPALEYDRAEMAQEWAFRLARTGELKHNPDLPISMGENIAKKTELGQDPKVGLVLMVQDMVVNDEGFNNANRNNILGNYDKLSIGVAVEGDTVILVLNFK